jgi:tryptophanyl-tRNA synthetase
VGDGGAFSLKQVVTEAVNEHLRPLRERRAELAADAGLVRSVLARGAVRANEEANQTLADVHAVLGMRY